MVYATACVYRDLYGKITDRKKNCVNNYLIRNEVFLPQMCGELVSCVEFRAILTPFSELYGNRYSSWPDVTSQIAFSSKGKVPNHNKNNSSIKPNKFHSKYVCFGGRKTREERKLFLKIHLFGFPQRLTPSSRTIRFRFKQGFI